MLPLHYRPIRLKGFDLIELLQKEVPPRGIEPRQLPLRGSGLPLSDWGQHKGRIGIEPMTNGVATHCDNHYTTVPSSYNARIIQWLGHLLVTQESGVQFPVRAV